MTILREYGLESIDGDGVPLDWERCRACWGTRRIRAPFGRGEIPCMRCNGYGSLRDAAFHGRVQARLEASGDWSARARCEDCGHPAKDGPWGDDGQGAPLNAASAEAQLAFAAGELAHGAEPDVWERLTHWTPCDHGCRHRRGGALRVFDADGHHHETGSTPTELLEGDGVTGVSASWRHVDVRRLGGPGDVRVEALRILCMRCWATRETTKR